MRKKDIKISFGIVLIAHIPIPVISVEFSSEEKESQSPDRPAKSDRD